MEDSFVPGRQAGSSGPASGLERCVYRAEGFLRSGRGTTSAADHADRRRRCAARHFGYDLVLIWPSGRGQSHDRGLGTMPSRREKCLAASVAAIGAVALLPAAASAHPEECAATTTVASAP